MNSFGMDLSARSPLVKDNLAETIRREIVAGQLRPGELIVETRWASRLKVAQASVREALNILAAEGFVQKSAGRSARVTRLDSNDVRQIYQVRSVLEGLAARLIAERKPDLREAEEAVDDMQAAAQRANMAAFYRRDLQFHLLLAEKSGNRFLVEDLKRHIVPLFAFVVLRREPLTNDPRQWEQSVEEHRQIVAVLKRGDPSYAEQHMLHAIRHFGSVTMNVLEEPNVAAKQTVFSTGKPVLG